MPSPETLAALEADFKRIVVANRGSADVLGQYGLKDSIGWNVGVGACRGLSYIWLAYRHTPTIGTNLLQELRSNTLPAEARKALIATTEKAHLAQGSKTDTDDSVNFQKTVQMMAGFGLSFRETKLFGGGWGKGHTDLGTFINNNPGYYLVSIPGHAMAACSGRGLPAFYDPNIGEATFVDGATMGNFFSQYFKSPVMARNYGAAGKVQVTISRYV